ncbi:MAG TPA: DNA polymerase III subunit gamma/tau, partial [Lacipirellulaceae bacterium]|nr:DNA polymerase III subunit gamma/tau [Lacipirellulaceae bacterium]
MSDSSPAAGEYVVVARRYRPQRFEELIGQEHVAQALQNAIASERVGHAYLFTGARGVGKTSAARILAKCLNCERGTSPTPCGQCEPCQSIAAGSDVDVLEIDGASNRGIEEIRQLRQNVAVRPSRSRFKIYIIDEVHMLTREAFNALLKTLEEPPEHVKFIFATTEANKIPITILSRCQRYDFAGIDSQAIHERLAEIAATEGVTADADALALLAIRAAGSMRDSQSLLEQLLSTGAKHISSADVTSLLGLAPAARLSRLVEPLVERNPAAALAALDATISEGVDVGQLIDQLLGYFRDVLTLAVGCGENQLLYALPAQREEIRSVSERLGVETLLAISQVLDQTAARLRASTQARTLAEMALVRICRLQDLDDLASLIAELRSGEPMTPASRPAPPPPGPGLAKKNEIASPHAPAWSAAGTRKAPAAPADAPAPARSQ